MKLPHLHFTTLAICLMTISTGQAFADDKVDFKRMVLDPAEQKLVLGVAKQSGVVINEPCPSADFTILDRFAIYRPMVFEGSAFPKAGAWKQSVAEKGCGQDRVLNVFFWLDSNNKMREMPLFPGDTHADPVLQKDAMQHAAMAAQWPEKDCKTGWMENTEFLKETGNPLEGAKDKPWDELWTLASCTKKAQVIMHFIPDKTGTTIHTSLQETKFLPNKLAQ